MREAEAEQLKERLTGAQHETEVGYDPQRGTHVVSVLLRPKDVRRYIRAAKKVGYEHRVIKEAETWRVLELW